MALFPTIPRDTQAELFVNNNWTDITGDVYARDQVTITRGARDETSTPEPSSCRLTLNNRSGNYSPRNPNGAYYGSIGRNTPLRISIGKDADTFTRTVSNGWGSTETLSAPWTTFGSGGTIAASDYNVTSGTGRHSVPVNSGIRATALNTVAYGDVDVSVTASLSLASVTGDLVGVGSILMRGLDASNYVMVYVYVDVPTGNYWIGAYQIRGGITGSLSFADINTGVAYVNAQPVKIRAQTEGNVVFGKLWLPTGPEPYDWTVIGYDSDMTNMGWVGVRSDIGVGNTNTKPIVATYDNLVIRVPRYSGEVSYWPQRWDTSGSDFYVPIEAAGIKRRIGQGTAPIKSAMKYNVLSLATPPLAYWPCEDGANANQISASIGLYPMSVAGKTKFAEFSGFLGSQSLPTLDAGSWRARISPSYTSSGYLSISHLFHVSTSDAPDNHPMCEVYTTGTASVFQIRYRAGGAIAINAWAGNTLLYDSGPLGVGFSNPGLDQLCLVRLLLHQNGANIDLNISSLVVGETLAGGFDFPSAVTARTIGNANFVIIDNHQVLTGMSVGHVCVRNENTSLFDLNAGLNAYSGPVDLGGESAIDRMIRLTGDGGVPFAWQTQFATGRFSSALGPQKPLALLPLLEEAAEADMGILHELRGMNGLMYRSRSSLYNQTPMLSLDYSSRQVAPPLEPVDDDQFTRNDVLAKRIDGGEFELFLSSGRLSINDPWNGGVGVYDDSPTLSLRDDDQLPDAAGWWLLLGTQDEARYPTVKVNLHSPGIVTGDLDSDALATNVGDRIEITNIPTGISPNTVAQIVRGYTETISPFEHSIAFVCSPAAPYDVLRAGVSGKMTVETDGSTLASSATTTATTLSVATTAGEPLWVTGAVSFDVLVEGERITVTNISGASSPQSFTVVRSVNGIVKAHSSGAKVGLFRPALVGR